jgi:hypothetical protein
MKAYKNPPEPYNRPGIPRKRTSLSPEGRAYLQRLIDNHGATERPMTAGHAEAG